MSPFSHLFIILTITYLSTLRSERRNFRLKDRTYTINMRGVEGPEVSLDQTVICRRRVRGGTVFHPLTPITFSVQK